MRGKRPALSLDLDCFFDVNSHVHLILFYFSYKRGQYESNTMADDKFSQNVPFIHNHFSGHHEVLISKQSCVFWSWLPPPIATLFLLHRYNLCCKLPPESPNSEAMPIFSRYMARMIPAARSLRPHACVRSGSNNNQSILSHFNIAVLLWCRRSTKRTHLDLGSRTKWGILFGRGSMGAYSHPKTAPSLMQRRVLQAQFC